MSMSVPRGDKIILSLYLQYNIINNSILNLSFIISELILHYEPLNEPNKLYRKYIF